MTYDKVLTSIVDNDEHQKVKDIWRRDLDIGRGQGRSRDTASRRHGDDSAALRHTGLRGGGTLSFYNTWNWYVTVALPYQEIFVFPVFSI